MCCDVFEQYSFLLLLSPFSHIVLTSLRSTKKKKMADKILPQRVSLNGRQINNILWCHVHHLYSCCVKWMSLNWGLSFCL